MGRHEAGLERALHEAGGLVAGLHALGPLSNARRVPVVDKATSLRPRRLGASVEALHSPRHAVALHNAQGHALLTGQQVKRERNGIARWQAKVTPQRQQRPKHD